MLPLLVFSVECFASTSHYPRPERWIVTLAPSAAKNTPRKRQFRPVAAFTSCSNSGTATTARRLFGNLLSTSSTTSTTMNTRSAMIWSSFLSMHGKKFNGSTFLEKQNYYISQQSRRHASFLNLNICSTVRTACNHGNSIPLTRWAPPLYQQNKKNKYNVSILNIATRHDCLSSLSSSSSLFNSSASKSHDGTIIHNETESADVNHVDTDVITLKTLPQVLSQAFLQNDTDGILQIAPKILSQSFTGQELILSALEATKNHKGQTASILNALVASCTHPQYCSSQSASMVWDMYTTWEHLKDELELYPDTVTFCCVYSALKRVAHGDKNDEYWSECAHQVLEQAQRYSKKIAGSKRRKMLNAIARKVSAGTGTGKDSPRGKDNVPQARNHLEFLRESFGVDFDILHEDENVVVVNKPSGMVCFHTHKTKEGKIGRKKTNMKKMKHKNKEAIHDASPDSLNDTKYSDISLEDALIHIGIPLSTLNPDALGLVHRIDRGTSGCIVFAKNDDAHARLVAEFFSRRVEKQYLALVPYIPTKKSMISMDMDKGGVISEAIQGKPALSTYKVVQTIGTTALMLEIQTKTGRKHQVREHCANALGRPIFLDPLYTSGETTKSKTSKNKSKVVKSNHNIPSYLDSTDGKRFFLHASTLNIVEFGVDATSPVPSWWTRAIKEVVRPE